MSRTPQTNANLQTAIELRKQGYKSRMFLPEMAEFKKWFDDEYGKGGKSLYALHRDGSNMFKTLKIPSLPALTNYAKNHYHPATITIEARGVDWLTLSEKVNEMEVLSDLLLEAKELFKHHAAKEKETFPGAVKRSDKAGAWFERTEKTAMDLFNIKRQLRVYGDVQPETVNNNQFNINSGNTVVMTPQQAVAILDDVKEVQEWEKRVSAYRDTTASEV